MAVRYRLQAGLGINHAGNHQGTAGNQRTDGIGEDMLEHQPSVARAKRPCRKHVLAVFKAVKLHSRRPGGGRDIRRDRGVLRRKNRPYYGARFRHTFRSAYDDYYNAFKAAYGGFDRNQRAHACDIAGGQVYNSQIA